MKSGISVVINTLNEERNLPNALASVNQWADDIVVVDMHSEDRTCEIARDFGARLFFHDRIRDFDKARQFAIDQAACEWVLILDADEMVVPILSRQLIAYAASGEADVIVIPRLNYDLCVPMMHSGSGPDQDRQMRFFRQGKLSVDSKIHAFLKPVPGARVKQLPFKDGGYLVHFGFLDTTLFLEKLVRYTGIEAAQAFEHGEKASSLKMLWKAAKAFVSRYFLYGGYRDGWRGLNMSLYLAGYRIMTYAKLRQLQEVGDVHQVQAACQQMANSIMQEYASSKVVGRNQ
jgi:(heptosyl)LPS beta-1,4-glucosyltransferase